MHDASFSDCKVSVFEFSLWKFNFGIQLIQKKSFSTFKTRNQAMEVSQLYIGWLYLVVGSLNRPTGDSNDSQWLSVETVILEANIQSTKLNLVVYHDEFDRAQEWPNSVNQTCKKSRPVESRLETMRMVLSSRVWPDSCIMVIFWHDLVHWEETF